MDFESYKLFLEVDKFFDDKSVNVDKFNANHTVSDYCPEKNGSKGCDNDYQRINAIGGHLIKQLYFKNSSINGGNNNNRFIEYFIMWLSHILYRKLEDHTITLKSAYDKHLKDNFGEFRHWYLLQDKRYMANSNMAIMNLIYLFFQQICDTIKIYKKPHILGHEYANKALECYFMYDKISNLIKHCGPYLELLDHLRTIYNEFIKKVKRERRHVDILDQLMDLPEIDKTKLGCKFKTGRCIRLHQKLEKNNSKIIKLGIKMLKDDAKRRIRRRSNSIASQDTEDDDDDDDGDDDDNVDDDDDDDDSDSDSYSDSDIYSDSDADVVDDAADDDDNDADAAYYDEIIKKFLSQLENSQQGASSVPAPQQTQQVQTPAAKKSVPTPQQPLAQPTTGQSTSTTSSITTTSPTGTKSESLKLSRSAESSNPQKETKTPTTQPEAQRKVAAKVTSPQTPATKPAAVKPAPPQTVATKPVPPQKAATKPENSKSIPAQTAAKKPATSKPATSKPAPAKPAPAKPAPAK
ncbi:Plasmodium variant antigen protein Cir/Yir/Bir, putative, partial [Plasmodium chabaudi adami]